jgi:hypothetical protein
VSIVPADRSERRRGSITRKHRQVFLERLAAGFSVAASAAPTGKHRRRYYELRELDDGFRAQWDDAWAAGQDRVEDELLRAATEGWTETEETFDEDGKLIRRVERQRKNPALLAKLERKRQPETQPLVEVNLRPAIDAKPVSIMDMLDVYRSTGQMHLLTSMHPHMLRALSPGLTPSELEALTADVVDGEAEEVDVATENRRSPVASACQRRTPPRPRGRDAATPDELAALLALGGDDVAEDRRNPASSAPPTAASAEPRAA